MSIALAQPIQAEARHQSRKHWNKKHGHYHHRSYNRYRNTHLFGDFVFSLPRGFIKISVGGKKYHYHDGVYYHKTRYGYSAIPAPIGACIVSLPYGYQNFYVDGVPYYTHNDVYYKHTRNGYEVIHKPYSKHARGSQVREEYGDSESENSITLKVRNKEGGFISITVRPSGSGYVGPQGEYYDEFPKIKHLKAIYGS